MVGDDNGHYVWRRRDAAMAAHTREHAVGFDGWIIMGPMRLLSFGCEGKRRRSRTRGSFGQHHRPARAVETRTYLLP